MVRIWVCVSVALAALVLVVGFACAMHNLEQTQIVEPKASFMAAPTYGTGPLTVQFSDESTGDINSWAWDFDADGVVDSVEQNPTYVYKESGMYNISLVVDGPDG